MILIKLIILSYNPFFVQVLDQRLGVIEALVLVQLEHLFVHLSYIRHPDQSLQVHLQGF